MVRERKKNEHYGSVFIEKATALAEDIGPSRAGRILGVDTSLIGKWICRKRDGRYMAKNDTPEEKVILLANREIQKLKRENEELKKANIVLKEIASVFSKDHPNSNLRWSEKSPKKGKQK